MIFPVLFFILTHILMKFIASLVLFFLPILSFAQPANVSYNWNNARFGSTSANAVQYKLARVYYNNIHWGKYASIKFSIRPDHYSSGEIEYIVTVQPGGAYLTCTKAVGSNERIGIFRMTLGPAVSTGNSYSGEPNYYRDIFLQIDNYASCRIDAHVSGYYHAFDKLSISDWEYEYCSLFTTGVTQEPTAPAHFYDEKRFGISYLNPKAKLHIFKSTTTENDLTLAIDGPANSERAIGFYDFGTLAWWFGRDNNNALGLDNGIGFWRSGTGTAFAIKDNGQVAIGTSTPLSADAKLSVKGMVVAQKVKVTQTGWADFVFQKNYQLPTLHELEQYIRDHQHLPDIPSAAEVEKEGVDLGEMNKKLLQKIEELTLHLIEQNKRLEALEKENAAMKKK